MYDENRARFVEQLINRLFYNKVQAIADEEFFVRTTILDKEKAARYLSQYLSDTIRYALEEIQSHVCVKCILFILLFSSCK